METETVIVDLETSNNQEYLDSLLNSGWKIIDKISSLNYIFFILEK